MRIHKCLHAPLRSRFYYLNEGADEQGQPEGQAPAETNEGEGESYEVPDKFKGATPEETIAKMGKSYAELEKRLGEGDKTPSEIAEIKNSLNELRSSLESKKEADPNELESQHKEYLKRLGFSTTEDVERAKESGRKEAEYDRINENLGVKYDGKDGKPKFDRQEIEDYAKENKAMGYTSLHPEVLYKLKYESELADWRVKEALKGNRSPIVPVAKKGSGAPSGKDNSNETEDQRRERMKAKFESGE